MGNGHEWLVWVQRRIAITPGQWLCRENCIRRVSARRVQRRRKPRGWDIVACCQHYTRQAELHSLQAGNVCVEHACLNTAETREGQCD